MTGLLPDYFVFKSYYVLPDKKNPLLSLRRISLFRTNIREKIVMMRNRIAEVLDTAINHHIKKERTLTEVAAAFCFLLNTISHLQINSS